MQEANNGGHRLRGNETITTGAMATGTSVHHAMGNESGLSGYGDFFGDSRATDMISDKGEQLSDYFDIELTINYKSNNKRYSIQRRR